MNDQNSEIMNESAYESRPNQSIGLAARSELPIETSQPQNGKTSLQLRTEEVSQALVPAYQRAGTCEMTDEEIAQLTAPFPDEFIEIRPHDGLIYLPHIHISDRLTKVFKPGKWVLIRRRDWYDSTSHTMFGEYVLIIRGCLIGESTGGHPYVPNNPKQNLSDVLESTAAEALRRIAGKRLSCGSQVWNPNYARDWVHNYGARVGGKWEKRFSGEDQAPQEFPKADRFYREREPQPQSKMSTNVDTHNTSHKEYELKPAAPMAATEKTRAWMLGNLSQFHSDDIIQFAMDKGWLTAESSMTDWPLEHVPTNRIMLGELIREIEAFVAPKAQRESEWFWHVVITLPRSGMTRDQYYRNPDTIRSLYDSMKAGVEPDRKRFWGIAKEYYPEPRIVDGKEVPPTEQETMCRKALDAFLEWHEGKE